MTLSGRSIMAIWDCILTVLIPLLVDDPLWASIYSLTKTNNGSLNPSFSGWPSLGIVFERVVEGSLVLSPLLVDDPLWVDSVGAEGDFRVVLIPLLVDDPLWVSIMKITFEISVLIPLLVDDPLWEIFRNLSCVLLCLNPSFSGWPSLGVSAKFSAHNQNFVLIPLLVDDPLWGKSYFP